MVSSSRHTYFIHLSRFQFSELSCQHFSLWFLSGHFNMSSLCDIKYTLVGTERGKRGRMEERSKGRGRESEGVRENH